MCRTYYKIERMGMDQLIAPFGQIRFESKLHAPADPKLRIFSLQTGEHLKIRLHLKQKLHTISGIRKIVINMIRKTDRIQPQLNPPPDHCLHRSITVCRK